MSAQPAYTRGQIALHWLTALFVVVAWFSHDAMEENFDRLIDTGREPYPTVHSIAGITVFFLVLARLWLRHRQGGPEPHGDGTQQQLAVWGHRLLYLLLIAVPLGGFLTWIVGLHGLNELHGLGGKALLIVALGHALVALWHQYVRKDGTLLRMMRPLR